MNLKVEYGIIAILLLAFLYYFFTHQSLLSDLSSVPDKGNQELKAVKGKHAKQHLIDSGVCDLHGPPGHWCPRGYPDPNNPLDAVAQQKWKEGCCGEVVSD
jgi:hypothetical protein